MDKRVVMATMLATIAITKLNPCAAQTVDEQADRKHLAVEAVLQNPVLPTGCEITSLTTVLNYYGYDVDKEYMVEEYLAMGEIGITNPNDAFIGSPYDPHSCGCYAPVIVSAAENYLSDVSSELEAINFTGIEMDELKNYIDQEIPVIIWATIDMAEPEVAVTWEIDGEEISWLNNSHCVVLIGYDDDKDTYIIADSLEGTIEQDQELVTLRYEQQGKQAVILAS